MLATLGLGLGPSPLSLDLTLASPWLSSMPPWLTVALNGSASLPAILAIALSAVAFSLRVGRTDWAAAFGVALLAEVPTAAIKAIIDRPRPPLAIIEAFGSSASYPSGHTVRAIVFAGLFAALLAQSRPPLRRAAVPVAMIVVASVALARNSSGEHWPSDVIGGVRLGSAWLIACLQVLSIPSDDAR